jgi:hypothetical protein
MSVLDRHCEEVGRDPSSICRTVLVSTVVVRIRSRPKALLPRTGDRPSPLRPVAGTPAAHVVERLGELLGRGADGLILNCREEDIDARVHRRVAGLAREALRAPPVAAKR